MSPVVALWAATWVALVVLYLCLSAVLREVRLLRGQVARLQEQLSTRPAQDGQGLPGPLPVLAAHAPRVVLVAESGCPLCRLLLAHLSERAGQLAVAPAVLTWQPAQAWGEVPGGRTFIRDEQAWSALAHLQPPVVLLVDADGKVLDLVLPVNEAEVDRTLSRWNLALTRPAAPAPQGA